MTITVKTPSQILDEAADILAEDERWIQGEYHAPCPTDENAISHCADGALQVAAGLVSFELDAHGQLQYSYLGSYESEEAAAQHRAYHAAYIAASEQVKEALGPGPHINVGIIGYNDTDGRKRTEVVGVLRAAAAKERARELAPAA